MTPRPYRHGYCLLLAAVCLGTLSVSLPAQQQPPPRFRTGVEITPVDVTVLDNERRRPIRGLTADDFVVRVDGEIQRIAAFHEVEIPGADKSTAEWTRGAPADVASNTIEEPRLFVIIMDDVAVPFNVFNRNKGKEIAHRIIDSLGPRDLAAVIFPEKNYNAQDLTADRAALRRAVETYQPFTQAGRLRSLAVLRKTRQFLHQQLPGHRRAIVYITTGFTVGESELSWTLRLDDKEGVAAASAGGEREITTRLDLRPGRYNVRIAAARSGDGATGSVYTTFTVPDFQREALSLSGVAIGRASGAAIGGREVLADIFPFAPTSIREFASSEKVGALMRVYQSSRRSARQVTVVTRVIDEMGKQMLTQSSVYEAARFAPGKGAEHRFEFPLSTLDPGDYLLTFVASTGEGGAQAHREVRFSVQ